MSWSIQYAAKAKQDLQSIYSYIAYELLAPETATKQLRRLTETIRSLQEMPMRFAVYDEEPWKTKGIRTVCVGNYLVFYLPQEETHSVTVVRIIYGGRDLKKQDS